MSGEEQAEEAAYYQAVEDYFVSRRGDPLILSNADWNLVRRWRQAGLPLRVVLRGVRDAMDSHLLGWSRDRKVGSLAYCAREVETARERWERALSLGGELDGHTRGALEAMAEALERAELPDERSRGLAAEIAAAVRSEAPGSLAELTAWLTRHETRLLAAIHAAEGLERRAARERGVEEVLAPWAGRMPAQVLDHLRGESLTRRTLEDYGLPRLSLFHLEGGGGGSP